MSTHPASAWRVGRVNTEPRAFEAKRLGGITKGFGLLDSCRESDKEGSKKGRVMIAFGEILKNKRVEKGLSQKDVSEYLNVSCQSISKWEKGLSEPTFSHLVDLAECLECEIGDFFVKSAEDQINCTSLIALLEVEAKLAKKELDVEQAAMGVAEYSEEDIESMERAVERIKRFRTITAQRVCSAFSCSSEEAQRILDALESLDGIEKLDISGTYYVSKQQMKGVMELVWLGRLLAKKLERRERNESIVDDESEETLKFLKKIGAIKENEDQSGCEE